MLPLLEFSPPRTRSVALLSRKSAFLFLVKTEGSFEKYSCIYSGANTFPRAIFTGPGKYGDRIAGVDKVSRVVLYKYF